MNLIGHYGTTAGYCGFMLQDVATGAVFAGSINQGSNLGALVLPMIQAIAGLPLEDGTDPAR